MRWLLVSSQHHPTHGGIGTYVSRFVRAATRAGWKVDLLTRPSDRLPEGAAVHTIETEDMRRSFDARVDGLRRIERIRPYRYGLWARAVAERLLRMPGSWDAIEFVDSQAEGYAAITSRRVRQQIGGTPMLVHAHTPMWIDERVAGADPTRFGRPIYHDWERQAIASADGVMCTSTLLARELSSRRAPAVIPYPIDIDAAPPRDRARRPEIILVGTVQPRKGVDVWARSLGAVLRAHPRARATLIGPDTPTGPNGTSMVAFARELLDPSVRDRLEWLGPIDHGDVMKRVATAAAVVVPSVFESFSFAAAEALEIGTPVIVSECVGIAEHVQGIMTVPTGDAAALAEAQCRVLSDPVAARVAALGARESMRTTCSGAEHLRRRTGFLATVASSGPPAHTGVDTLDGLAAFLTDVEACESRSSVLS